jgi:hypothetical protein
MLDAVKESFDKVARAVRRMAIEYISRSSHRTGEAVEAFAPYIRRHARVRWNKASREWRPSAELLADIAATSTTHCAPAWALPPNGKIVCYAPVSSHDQAEQLKTQAPRLEKHCRDAGFTDAEVLNDLGTSLNHHKKALQRLLQDILDGRVVRPVLVTTLAASLWQRTAVWHLRVLPP